MFLQVCGITYQKTVDLIFGTNCHLWCYTASYFMDMGEGRVWGAFMTGHEADH
jgi:hypothetical protein